jgi:hypothetical protein
VNIKFHDKVLKCRHVKTYPSRFRLGDLLIGPGGMILEVVTVQSDCPIWESKYKTKTAVVFRTESGQIIPISEMKGEFDVYRLS